MKNSDFQVFPKRPNLSNYERNCLCDARFRDSGPYWHLYTSEKHPVFLSDEASFRTAMNIIAFCSKLHPDVTTLTFEWMTNHYHGVHRGSKNALEAFFREIIIALDKSLRASGKTSTPGDLSFSLREITSLKDLRNVIAYNNRNGFLVSPDHSPFSYPWGANKYYFNAEAKLRFLESGKPSGLMQRRELFHTKRADRIQDLIMLDGYACPMCFCDIKEGESMYLNCHQYFYAVSRNLESHKAIAAEISESVFYTDEELFASICAISSKQFGQPNPSLVPKEAIIDLAKTMHFDFNASNKQICRILHLDQSNVNSLFPKL